MSLVHMIEQVGAWFQIAFISGFLALFGVSGGGFRVEAITDRLMVLCLISSRMYLYISWILMPVEIIRGLMASYVTILFPRILNLIVFQVILNRQTPDPYKEGFGVHFAKNMYFLFILGYFLVDHIVGLLLIAILMGYIVITWGSEKFTSPFFEFIALFHVLEFIRVLLSATWQEYLALDVTKNIFIIQQCIGFCQTWIVLFTFAKANAFKRTKNLKS